ncbi:hypothetical protein J6590_064825 [Homalodisca vitripennis]|nr:hypothetical protein J6590_064825 [Homalodisca vitripennis]
MCQHSACLLVSMGTQMDTHPLRACPIFQQNVIPPDIQRSKQWPQKEPPKQQSYGHNEAGKTDHAGTVTEKCFFRNVIQRSKQWLQNKTASQAAELLAPRSREDRPCWNCNRNVSSGMLYNGLSRKTDHAGTVTEKCFFRNVIQRSKQWLQNKTASQTTELLAPRSREDRPCWNSVATENKSLPKQQSYWHHEAGKADHAGTVTVAENSLVHHQNSSLTAAFTVSRITMAAITLLRRVNTTYHQLVWIFFPLGRPTAMHLSLKGFLRTPETHHEAHQSTTSAVQHTAENNLSSPPGKIHHSCPNYQRWHTALLLLQGNQRAGAQQSPPAHYTFHRADPPEGCHSVKMLPQVTMPRNETNDLRRH